MKPIHLSHIIISTIKKNKATGCNAIEVPNISLSVLLGCQSWVAMNIWWLSLDTYTFEPKLFFAARLGISIWMCDTLILSLSGEMVLTTEAVKDETIGDEETTAIFGKSIPDRREGLWHVIRHICICFELSKTMEPRNHHWQAYTESTRKETQLGTKTERRLAHGVPQDDCKKIVEAALSAADLATLPCVALLLLPNIKSTKIIPLEKLSTTHVLQAGSWQIFSCSSQTKATNQLASHS